MIEVGLLVVRTRRLAQGDLPGLLEQVGALLASHSCSVREVLEVPPDREAIAEQLAFMADRLHLPLVLSLGGTGLHPEDVTPDATAQVIHRPAPGIAEALRARVGARDPHFMLTRGVAGVRGRTLIVNLPDEPEQVLECLRLFGPVAAAAVARLRPEPHGAPLQTRLL